MKSNIMRLMIMCAVLSLSVSCRDRDAEKKIAELESRLAEVEGKKTTTPVNTAPANDPAKEEKPEGPLPTLQFAKLEHDFGTIEEGKTVEYSFSFKNNGEAPLIIQDARPSCGCTVPDWSKQPIPVGGTGFVRAKFDSSGKPGIQNKTITVVANTYPKQTVLRFKAMVTPKPTGAEGPVK